MDAKQLDDVLTKAREAARGTDIDSLTIKDLKVALKPGVDEKTLHNNQRASIVTVVILIVDT
jgi:hypothetical protein